MNSEFRPSSVVCDNMMFQRNHVVPIRGFGPDGKEVVVSFNGQVKKSVIQCSRWEVELDPMDVVREGMPMTLTCGEKTIRVENILVGDVWLASGQSNMCFYVDYLQPATREAITSDYDYPQIRFFREKELLNEQPQEEAVEGRWIVGKSENIGSCPAVGTLFARGLYKKLNIPIGIFTVAYGGVRIETFIKEKTLKESGLPLYPLAKENAYNAMFHPVVPYACCGMVWYQGEANCTSEEHRQYYHQYMKLLVEQARREMCNPNMPVLQVQLPSYGGADADYTEIRFEQMKAETVIPNLYTTVNYDTGEANEIHPSDKLPIGERLVNMALEKYYGKDLKNRNCYPTFESAKTEGNQVIFTFNHIDKGLEIVDGLVDSLELCGSDGQYYAASAEVIDHNQLKVQSENVSHPTGVRYGCQSNLLDAHLRDKNGNPAKPFRETL